MPDLIAGRVKIKNGNNVFQQCSVLLVQGFLNDTVSQHPGDFPVIGVAGYQVIQLIVGEPAQIIGFQFPGILPDLIGVQFMHEVPGALKLPFIEIDLDQPQVYFIQLVPVRIFLFQL